MVKKCFYHTNLISPGSRLGLDRELHFKKKMATDTKTRSNRFWKGHVRNDLI